MTWAPPPVPGCRSSTRSVDALPVTLELAALSLLLAVVVGIGAGVVAAVRRGRPAEWVANTLALLGLSIPNFWLGIVLILGLAIAVPVFAASGFVPFGDDPLDNLRRMVLPAVVLGCGLAAVVMRQTRAAMLDSLSADYVRTARAKGLARAPSSAPTRCATRSSPSSPCSASNSATSSPAPSSPSRSSSCPASASSPSTPSSPVTTPLVQGVVLFTSTAYILINLASTFVYSVIDPRIRLGGAP